MEILDFIIVVLFVAFMLVLIIGFNKQMQEKAKAREERYKNLKEKK